MSANIHNSASGQHVSSLLDIAQEVAAICLLKISVLSRSRFYRPIAHDQWVVPTLCCCMISEWFPHCAAAWSVSGSHTVLLHDHWVLPTLCCCMISEWFPHCAAAWSVSGSHTVLLHDHWVVPTLCCCMFSEWFSHCAAAWSVSGSHNVLLHDQWVVPTLFCCMISEWFPHCAAAWSVSGSHNVLLHDQWVVPTLCCCCRTLVLHKLRHVFYNWNNGKNEKCPTAYMIHGDRYRMYSAVKWVIRDFRREFRKTWNLK